MGTQQSSLPFARNNADKKCFIFKKLKSIVKKLTLHVQLPAVLHDPPVQLRVGRPAPEDAPGVAGPRGVGQGRGRRLPAGAAGGLKKKGKVFWNSGGNLAMNDPFQMYCAILEIYVRRLGEPCCLQKDSVTMWYNCWVLFLKKVDWTALEPSCWSTLLLYKFLIRNYSRICGKHIYFSVRICSTSLCSSSSSSLFLLSQPIPPQKREKRKIESRAKNPPPFKRENQSRVFFLEGFEFIFPLRPFPRNFTQERVFIFPPTPSLFLPPPIAWNQRKEERFFWGLLATQRS